MFNFFTPILLGFFSFAITNDYEFKKRGKSVSLVSNELLVNLKFNRNGELDLLP